MRRIRLPVGLDFLEYEIDGPTAYGADEVLLDADDNLIANTSWKDSGFVVAPCLNPNEMQAITERVTELVFTSLQKCDPDARLKREDFKLEKYHEFIKSEKHHLELVMSNREGFELSDLPFPISKLEAKLSKLSACPLTVQNPRIPRSAFYIRIVRPHAPTDNNPPHRDVWLDRLRDGVNLYLPIAGSNERSALPLVPRSHFLKESEIERTCEGATVNGVKYRVPAVTNWQHDLSMIRPNPKPGEIMLFSPYLIHGGGVNFNRDQTRVSVEMRFFRKAED